MEKTMTVELTYEQYKHITNILNQNKPSRTRLTKDEKGMIMIMASEWQSTFSTTTYEDELLASIRKKLK